MFFASAFLIETMIMLGICTNSVARQSGSRYLRDERTSIGFEDTRRGRELRFNSMRWSAEREQSLRQDEDELPPVVDLCGRMSFP